MTGESANPPAGRIPVGHAIELDEKDYKYGRGTLTLVFKAEVDLTNYYGQNLSACTDKDRWVRMVGVEPYWGRERDVSVRVVALVAAARTAREIDGNLGRSTGVPGVGDEADG